MDDTTLIQGPIEVAFDPRWPRIVSLCRRDTGGILLGCPVGRPFVVEVDGTLYTAESASLVRQGDCLQWKVRLPALAVELLWSARIEEEAVVLKLEDVHEKGGYALNRLHIPNHGLVTGLASRGDQYFGPLVRRSNWSRSWCPGVSWAGGSEDFGPVAGGIPFEAPAPTAHACVWNEGICATVVTSIRVDPLHFHLAADQCLLPNRAGTCTISAGIFAWRLRGRRAAKPEIRVAVLGHYNSNSQVNWCDAAAWTGDFALRNNRQAGRYHESILGKLDVEVHFKLLRTFANCLDDIRIIHSVSGGMRQIVYLVGWQGRGHDTCYPRLGPVNDRAGGPAALQQLVKDAAALNCEISVHANVDDAYEGNEQFDPSILGRDPDGQLHKWFLNHEVGGKVVHSIVHTLAMESGYHRRQIDELLSHVPIVSSVHFDAHRVFNECWPNAGEHIDAECEAQLGCEPLRRLLAERGIDITTEYIGLGMHEGGSWGWHGISHMNRWGAVMGHGRVSSALPSGVESIGLGCGLVYAEGPRQDWAETARLFYQNWMYSQVLARKRMLNYTLGDWNQGVEAWYSDETHVRTARDGVKPTELQATYEGIPIARGGDRFLPWRENDIRIYSRSGGRQRWVLPLPWKGCSLICTELRAEGTVPGPAIQVQEREIELDIPPGRPLRLLRE